MTSVINKLFVVVLFNTAVLTTRRHVTGSQIVPLTDSDNLLSSLERIHRHQELDQSGDGGSRAAGLEFSESAGPVVTSEDYDNLYPRPRYQLFSHKSNSDAHMKQLYMLKVLNDVIHDALSNEMRGQTEQLTNEDAEEQLQDLESKRSAARKCFFHAVNCW